MRATATPRCVLSVCGRLGDEARLWKSCAVGSGGTKGHSRRRHRRRHARRVVAPAHGAPVALVVPAPWWQRRRRPPAPRGPLHGPRRTKPGGPGSISTAATCGTRTTHRACRVCATTLRTPLRGRPLSPVPVPDPPPAPALAGHGTASPRRCLPRSALARRRRGSSTPQPPACGNNRDSLRPPSDSLRRRRSDCPGQAPCWSGATPLASVIPLGHGVAGP